MLAAFIKQLREQYQMTQEQVAEQLGMQALIIDTYFNQYRFT